MGVAMFMVLLVSLFQYSSPEKRFGSHEFTNPLVHHLRSLQWDQDI